MKKIFIAAVLAGLLNGCGTTTFSNSYVYKDILEQKNVCSTQLMILNYDLLTKGNPETVTISVYDDSNITLNSTHYRVYRSDQSGSVKEALVRVDNNKIIKMIDLADNDEKFTTSKHIEFKNQLIDGNNLVIRLNYYDGYTITLSADITDFKHDWSEMLVKCQAV